jgi:hypothetical protein
MTPALGRKATHPSRIPYQFSFPARRSVILFVIRCPFLICRVIHRSITMSRANNENWCRLRLHTAYAFGAEDFRMEDTEIPWTLEGMKSNIKFIADPVEKFHLAVHEWLLRIVRVKVKIEVDQRLGRKNRAVTTEESVSVAECFTPETLSRDFFCC